jgi:hypothetical protein
MLQKKEDEAPPEEKKRQQAVVVISNEKQQPQQQTSLESSSPPDHPNHKNNDKTLVQTVAEDDDKAITAAVAITNISTKAVVEQPPSLPLDIILPPSSTGSNHFNNESIYEFYVQQLLPAIQASLPILLGRLWHDAYATLQVTGRRILYFLLPWLNENASVASSHAMTALDWSQSMASRLAANMTLLWEQAFSSSTSNSSTTATSMQDAMLRNFDTNQDGHISPSEFVNMTEQFLVKLLQQASAAAPHQFPRPLPPSFWEWFSREWPLMDWKVGVFVWRSCGGLLLVISILTIIPGRLHGISGRILRWPILGITYFLISVELVVYIIIRVFIRMAESLIAHPKHRHLRRQLRQATSYAEWYQYAQQLDKSQRRDVWQHQGGGADDTTTTTTTTSSSSYRYNWSLIHELMTDMKTARQNNDSLLALAVLQQCTRKNVGGIMSEELFSNTNTGEPKAIVKEFVKEVVTTLHWVTDAAVQLSDPAADTLQASSSQAGSSSIPLPTSAAGDLPPSAAMASDQHAYEEHLQHKVKTEKDKIWRSLVSWATLAFQDKNPKAADGETSPNNKLSPSASSSSSSHHGGNNLDGIPEISNVVASTLSDQTTRNFPAFHRETVLTLLKRARAAYGRTALCLSGGAMMGNYHWGHVKYVKV